jgi:hypothetical protein
LRQSEREPASQSEDVEGANTSSRSPSPLVCREVQLADFESVRDLKVRLNLSSDNLENWRRLWIENPTLKHCSAQLGMGWVLEADRKIVGYLGTIPLTYHLSGRLLIAAAAHALVIEREFRSATAALLTRFYRQPHVHLFLNTTAIPAVGQIVTHLGALPITQESYGTALFWILDPEGFARAAADRLRFGGRMGRFGSSVAALLLRGDHILGRRPKRVRGLETRELKISEIGDEFARFWQERLYREPRLIANREPATLRWHFEIPGNRRSNQLIACYENARLVGYIILASDPTGNPGLSRTLVADLLVADDRSDITRHLLAEAYDSAKRVGSHVLDLVGFPKMIRDACAEGRPHSREYPACPFFYKTGDAALQSILARPTAWYGCPYDGDATLVP